MFLISALAIGLTVAMLTYAGVLTDFTGHGNVTMIPFYVGASLIAFTVPMLVVLWYVERTVSEPLARISGAARHFISSEDMSANTGSVMETYREYLSEDSEIGDLAVSLSKMTSDIETYVEDVRDLSVRQERLVTELNIAGAIQESFIPKDFDSVKSAGVDVYGSMSAAKFIGGDLYDFFMIDDRHLAFAIGDVSGKGVPAALVMAVTKSLLEGHATPGSEPGEILGAVNYGVSKDNERCMFTTAWMGILDVGTGEVRFANAGHSPPVIKRRGEAAALLKTRPGLVLGAMGDITYKSYGETLLPGDMILLYTDGVTEANDDYKEFYGEERLLGKVDEMQDRPVDEIVEAIRSDVLDHMGGSEQFDDITMLLLRYRGAPRNP